MQLVQSAQLAAVSRARPLSLACLRVGTSHHNGTSTRVRAMGGSLTRCSHPMRCTPFQNAAPCTVELRCATADKVPGPIAACGVAHAWNVHGIHCCRRSTAGITGAHGMDASCFRAGLVPLKHGVGVCRQRLLPHTVALMCQVNQGAHQRLNWPLVHYLHLAACAIPGALFEGSRCLSVTRASTGGNNCNNCGAESRLVSLYQKTLNTHTEVVSLVKWMLLGRRRVQNSRPKRHDFYGLLVGHQRLAPRMSTSVA